MPSLDVGEIPSLSVACAFHACKIDWEPSRLECFIIPDSVASRQIQEKTIRARANAVPKGRNVFQHQPHSAGLIAQTQPHLYWFL